MAEQMQPMGSEDASEMGELVTCVHIYIRPDGSAMVKAEQEPMPEDGQPAASLDEAFDMARQMAENPPNPEEDNAMAEAQAGYARRARAPMEQSNPKGVFGE